MYKMYSLLLFLSLFLCSVYSQLQECGGILKVAEVQLMSPGYPGMLKPNVSCEWILQPVSDNICRLEVEFNLADLHDASLVIGDVAHSGSLAGIRSFSFHNSTTISFRNGKNISKGFNIIVKQKICEESLTLCGSVFSSREVIINGPPFAVKDCSFIIKQFSPDACQVEIYFQKHFLESSPNCIMGRLEIGKDVLCGTLDGYKRYDFNETELEIRFHTDNISFRNQFSLKLSQIICSRKAESFDKLEDFTIIQKINVPFLNNNPSEINYNYDSCCNRIYSERHFFIASPGFPNSNNIDCTYTVQKFSPDIQFLKLNFKYFWVGDQDNYYYNCYGGFLQIDGNFFCGCQTGQTWIEQFNFYSYPEFKTMRLSINQHSQNRFIGFVIEVTQYQSIGPLPNHYKRQLRDNFTNMFIKNYSSGVPHISKPINGNESKNEKLILNKTNDDFTNRKAKLQSHENIGILPDLYCLTWNIKDWIILLQQAVWAQLHCPVNTQILPSISKLSLPPISAYNQPTVQSNCTEIRSEHGWIQFPDPVSSVLHDEYCFRFTQIPGRCALEVVFHEINLPLILDCSQNYILITGIGKLCFIPNHKTVQIDFRKQSTKIKIKRQGRIGRKIHLHFQQLTCSSSTIQYINHD